MAEVLNVLTVPVMRKVYRHFNDDLPNECVGMVWDDGEVARLLNQAHSPERFSVSLPLLTEKLAAREGIVVAIYHSHPTGGTHLSSSDESSLRAQWRRDIFIPWLVVDGEGGKLWYPNTEGEITVAGIFVTTDPTFGTDARQAWEYGLVQV